MVGLWLAWGDAQTGRRAGAGDMPGAYERARVKDGDTETEHSIVVLTIVARKDTYR